MLTYYDLIVPVFTNSLTALKGVLAKGEAFAKEQKRSDEEMLGFRLAPDMFPLVRQVQIACDNAKGACARLTGTEAPKMEDTEKTCAELYARIDKTLAYLATMKKEDFESAATRVVRLPYFKDMHLSGDNYARFNAIPTFFFHLTTAYDILRSNGVPIGKSDYMGAVPFEQD